MSDWTPPSDGETWSSDDDDQAGDHRESGHPVGQPEVRVIAPLALPLRIEAVERDGIAAGERAFATFLEGAGMPERPIAVNSLPAEVVEALLASTLFGEPRLIAATLHEEEGGLRGILQALIPMDALRAWAEQVERGEGDGDEPWRASVPEVPSFEVDSGGAPNEDEEGEEVELVPFPLGVVLRFPEDRKYPGDILHEAADLLVSILGGTGTDANQKKIDRLLGEL